MRSAAPLLMLAVLGCPTARAQYFVERGADVGLQGAYHSNGVSVADYDGDGDLDLLVVPVRQYDPSNPATLHRLFRNDGGRFVDVSEESGISQAQVSGWPVLSFGNRFAAAWADYDRDDDPDVVLTGVGPEILFRNNGDGTFTDVSQDANINPPSLADDSTETVGATWWDYDVDGYPDLYLSNWNGPNRMHRNLGDGRFEDVSLSSGLADTSRTWSALPLDVNGDGLLDLYNVNDFGPNRLFLANGDGTFRDETLAYRLGDNGDSMGIASGDVNGDGRLDLYITNIFDREPNTLYVSAGTHFEDVATFLGVEDADWAWGTEFFDADHDGDEDLYVVNGHRLEQGTPNRFWLSRLVDAGRPGFLDETRFSGADSRVEARGLVVFDADGDGDLDMVAACWDGPVEYYENRIASGNWLQVSLRGTVSNPDGYGARLEAYLGGRLILRQHDGVDFAGQSTKPVHFGLADASLVDSLLIRWPSGITDRLFNVAANQTLSLVEGSATGTGQSGRRPSDGLHVVTVAPNPSLGSVQARGIPVGTALFLFDTSGRQVYQAQASAPGPVHIPRPGPGVYFLRLVGPAWDTVRPVVFY